MKIKLLAFKKVVPLYSKQTTMTKQNHEVLSLNAKRAYVLVNGTWYDTSKELYPQVGANFLTGMIDKVLSFEDYAEMFPESKTELLTKASDKIPAGGYIRKITNDGSGDVVRYGVSPLHLQTSGATEEERSN
jgi:hypothetical protein